MAPMYGFAGCPSLSAAIEYGQDFKVSGYYLGIGSIDVDDTSKIKVEVNQLYAIIGKTNDFDFENEFYHLYVDKDQKVLSTPTSKKLDSYLRYLDWIVEADQIQEAKQGKLVPNLRTGKAINISKWVATETAKGHLQKSSIFSTDSLCKRKEKEQKQKEKTDKLTTTVKPYISH
jgi:hypothetical protein